MVNTSNNLVEGLVDTNISMLVMFIAIVNELGIMHLVFGFKSYKTMVGKFLARYLSYMSKLRMFSLS